MYNGYDRTGLLIIIQVMPTHFSQRMDPVLFTARFTDVHLSLNTRKMVQSGSRHKNMGSDGSGERNIPVSVYSGELGSARKKSFKQNEAKVSPVRLFTVHLDYSVHAVVTRSIYRLTRQKPRSGKVHRWIINLQARRQAVRRRRLFDCIIIYVFYETPWL